MKQNRANQRIDSRGKKQANDLITKISTISMN